MSITWSKSSTSIASICLGREAPALLNRMSKGPAAAILACAAARSPTSSTMASADPPAAAMAATASPSSPAPRAASTTCAPASANAAAPARPMPREAPVMRARRLSRRREGMRGRIIARPSRSRRCDRHSGAPAHWPARHGQQTLPACTGANNIPRSLPRPHP